MKLRSLVLVALVCVASLALAACSAAPVATTSEPKPATVERLTGADPSRITLTEEAAKHLGLQVTTVTDQQVGGAMGKAVPYAAIVYDTEGKTWIYVSTAPQVFVRHPVTVATIKGDVALLSDGPDDGASVVTVGAEELFGSESEFQEE